MEREQGDPNRSELVLSHKKIEVRENIDDGPYLVACSKIRKGKLLFQYNGDVLTSEEGNTKYRQENVTKFMVHLGPRQVYKWIDASDKKYNDCLGRKLRSGENPNAKFCVREDFPGDIKLFVKTTREIQAGEEICVPSGPLVL